MSSLSNDESKPTEGINKSLADPSSYVSSVAVSEAIEKVEQVFERSRSRYSTQLVLCSLFFFGVSIFLFGSLVFWFLFRSEEVISQILSGIARRDPYRDEDPSFIFALYVFGYSAPFLILVAALICIVMGYVLLGQAGGLVRTAIPQEDQELLRILATQDEKSVEQYIRLTSLTGVTGFFTKINITGLPLATIALTIIFGALALLFDAGNGSSKFFDFANLTLGAFLGSYVQKQAIHSSTNSATTKIGE